MKKKWWQVPLSYLTEIYIERTGSDHNEILDVILKEGRYQLVSKNAVYSFEDKYHNFRTCFERMNWEVLNVEKVLVLGLGLGSVPQMLETVFHKRFEYHLVEIDEVVIDLAHRYVLEHLGSPMQVFNTDALVFLEVTGEKYDLVIMDIFDDCVVPEAFQTAESLMKMKKLLKKNGLLLYNRLNVTEDDHDETFNYYNTVFIKQFRQAYLLEMPTNIMLCSRNDVFKDVQ